MQEQTMAIYHASLRVISRGKGTSAVAAAAYRAGARLTDERTGTTHNYTAKNGVEHVETMLPASAPDWARDAGRLWNAVEAAERRSDASVARELILALPDVLPPEQRLELAQAVARALVDRYQVAVMLAIHSPDRHGDQRNHHAHLLMPTRAMTGDGLGKKVRVLDARDTGPNEVRWLREHVGSLTNEALAAAGRPERVDHRTLVAQAAAAEADGDYARAARLNRPATVHAGSSASARARRGEFSSAIAHNRRVANEHQSALDAYLALARRQGRLMPAATDVRRVGRPGSAPGPALPAPPAMRMRLGRGKGPGASVLAAQATANEAAHRAATRAQREYLEGLARTRRQLEEGMSRLVAQPPTVSDIPPAIANRGTSPEERALRVQLAEAQERLAEVRKVARARRATAVAAQERRRLRQKAAQEADEAPMPRMWQIRRRKQWDAMRRSRWAKLREAIRLEQAAREEASRKGMADLRARASVLRAEAERLEALLQGMRAAALREEPPLPHPKARPEPGQRQLRP